MRLFRKDVVDEREIRGRWVGVELLDARRMRMENRRLPVAKTLVVVAEKRTEDAELCGNVITFDMKPYEIKSFRIR